MQRSMSKWARRDRSSASLTTQRDNHSSIRTSRSSRCVLQPTWPYCILTFVRIFIILFTQQQQCFAGNSNSTNSTTQSSVPASTSTVSTTQSSTTDSTTTNSVPQTSTTDTTTTDSTQTSATGSTTTDSTSQTSATDASTTDSTSQTSATDATATPNSRLRHDAPRVVRHSARFGRSYPALFAN